MSATNSLTLTSNIQNSLLELSSGSYFSFYDINLSQEEIDILNQVKFDFNKSRQFDSFNYNTSLSQDKLKSNLINFFSYKLLDRSYATELAGIIENIYALTIYTNKPNQYSMLTVNIQIHGLTQSWHTDDIDSSYKTCGEYKNFITLIGPVTSFYNTSDENIIKEIQDIYFNQSEHQDSLSYLANNGVDNHLIQYSQVVKPLLGQGAIFGMDAVHSGPSEYIGDRLTVSILTITNDDIEYDGHSDHNWLLEL